MASTMRLSRANQDGTSLGVTLSTKDLMSTMGITRKRELGFELDYYRVT